MEPAERPYAFTALCIALAIALNMWTGNGLWLWYSVIGAAGFMVIFGMVRANRIEIPSVAVWMIGAGAAFHYIGGSMAGLHQIGGPNGLYYAFPWWDNMVHFLGSWAVAIAAVALLQGKISGPSWLLPLIGMCIGVTVGVLVELYEFAQFVFFATIDQGFYTNTLLDLYYNLLGAGAGAFLYVRIDRAKNDHISAVASTDASGSDKNQGTRDPGQE